MPVFGTTSVLYPLINGMRCDFSSAVIKVDGLAFNLKALDYKHTLDPGEARGNMAQVIGRSRGKYSAEASFEMYLAEYNFLIAALVAKGLGLRGYLEQSFDISASYAELPESPVITDLVAGCRIKSPGRSFSEGNEPLSVKCDLHVMYIKENLLNPIGGEGRLFLP